MTGTKVIILIACVLSMGAGVAVGTLRARTQPGPEQSRRSSAPSRLRRMRASPSSGSSARISTAPAVPGCWHTRLAHQCMP